MANEQYTGHFIEHLSVTIYKVNKHLLGTFVIAKWPRFPVVVWKEQVNCALKVRFWDFSVSHAMLVVLFGGRKSGIPISLILRAS